MLTTEQNERFTHVGPGTPGGNLMRRYWHAVATSQEILERPTKAVRLLNEDLVLYRDRAGTLGLIDRLCAHRRVDLSYGIPEEHGLRCMYHGWQYDETGQCIQQPFEETVHPDGRFKEKVKMTGYPVEELGGLIWAYLGAAPAPLLPRWDLLVGDDLVRNVGTTIIPCNWLQCMENSMDPVHTEWLHAYLTQYLRDGKGEEVPLATDRRYSVQRHEKIGFYPFTHGLYKRRLLAGQSDENDDWRTGHPVIFPTILRNTGGAVGGGTFQIRVPIDDTHTWHLLYRAVDAPDGASLEDRINVTAYELPLLDDRGEYRLDITLVQDFMAWATQGPIADRTKEMLGASDEGIIMFRQLLDEQMAIVEGHGEPMNVFRDAEANERVVVGAEQTQYQALPNQRSGMPLLSGR
jgi:5,5'-dehydrodivanillate O-demethylase